MNKTPLLYINIILHYIYSKKSENMEKKCSKCKEIKYYSDFHNRTASSDGKDGQCKECRSGSTYKYTDLKDAPDRNRLPAEEVLRCMGYELYNDNNSVYQQFKQRLIDKGIDLDEYPNSVSN